MAPLLLDKQAVRKAGVLLLLIWLATFALGYVIGVQQSAQSSDSLPVVASHTWLPCTQSDNLSLNESRTDNRGKSVVAEHRVDISASVAASEQGFPKMGSSDAMDTSTTSAESAEKASIVQIALPGDPSFVDRVASNLPAAKIRPVEPEPKLHDSAQGRTSNEPVSRRDIPFARYTIQVGMYGRRVNAENLLELLAVEGYPSYISSYKNKKQQQRFNVRFGHYQDKQEALEALKAYSASHQGNGYLIRIKQRAADKNNVSLAE